jgi:hypothetical protein
MYAYCLAEAFVEHRHLLPAEIDLLVDGDAHASAAGLVAQVEGCASCQRRVHEARLIASALESIPHAKPTLGFSDRVMQRVEVTPPWHGVLWDSVRGLMPQSRAVRTLASAFAVVGGIAVTLVGGWLAWRADGAALLGAKAVEQSRVAVAGVAGDALSALVGDAAMSALRSGGLTAAAIGAAVFVVALALVTLGFNRLAATARRRQGGAS